MSYNALSWWCRTCWPQPNLGLIQKKKKAFRRICTDESHFLICVQGPWQVCAFPSVLCLLEICSSPEVRDGGRMDLLAAVTRESPGLDPAAPLFRIEWVRVVWARAGGGPARFAALWSWSPGGFRTPPGVYGDERGSPSVLGRGRRVHLRVLDYI